MPHLKNILYLTACILYGTLAFPLFPIVHTNIIIPSVPLLAIGAWIYGRTIGLVLCLLGLVHHFFVYMYYADTYEYYTDRVIGVILVLITIFVVSHLKTNLEAIKSTNQQLDRLVEDRNIELANLTAKLLDNSESVKIRHGQDLHDGVGQQLTGVRLLSSSMHEQFLDENNPAASITDSIKIRTTLAHNQIRRVSQLLFPVRIGQVGLLPALRELSASLMAIKSIQFEVMLQGEPPPLPPMISLQLYRICQETTLHAIDELGADLVSVRIDQTRSNYLIGIEHNGEPTRLRGKKGPFELIQYRLKQISGDMMISTSTTGLELTSYTIPKSAVVF